MSQETAAPVIPETGQLAGPSPLIEIRNLTRTCHIGRTALHARKSVSLAIGHGEYVAAVGLPSTGASQ